MVRDFEGYYQAVQVSEQPSTRYQCKICNKVLTRESTAKHHLRIHFNIKKYECEVCSRRFTMKQYLVEHRYTHTQERPYKCKFPGCNRTFRQRGKLSIHRREHRQVEQKDEVVRMEIHHDNQDTDSVCSTECSSPILRGKTCTELDVKDDVQQFLAQAEALPKYPIMTNVNRDFWMGNLLPIPQKLILMMAKTRSTFLLDPRCSGLSINPAVIKKLHV
mmetsp:Transcript_64466/g.74027  ORF Transcript_64466/g.74027 Transcript_64466/m.74027 type:complete len:218 (-) Transcript_64466:566-1219(-)